MKTIKKLLPVLTVLAATLTATNAYATDGYFAHGYGVKAQGMGGVGIALPQDALAAATNPAGMGLIGDRVDFGLTWFRPQRETELVNTAGGSGFFDGTYKANDTENFFIPEFGYNRQFNPDVTLGVSVYGNGGMNTDYKKGIPLFGSTGSAGVDLAQLFIAPTVTWKLTPANTIGLSLNLAYQRFEARGLQGFAGFSSSPNNLSDRGHDNSFGAGVHIGWIGQLNDAVSLGATYQSRTYMSKLDKYKGLFAEQGDFDIPSSFGVGIAVKATPALTMAADVQHINYNEVASIGDDSISKLLAGDRLGASNGPGFGWKDATAVKLGVSYAYSDNLTLRAGYNHVNQPIRSADTFVNILALGVVEDHITLGATWVLQNKSELSFAYMHAFENEVKGRNSIPNNPLGGGNSNIKMYQDSIGIAYGWKL